jgi:hypothetical protein
MKTETPLQRQIKAYEAKSLNPFKPSRNFFSNVKIGQKRFWKIVRGDDSLKVSELEVLARYFNCNSTDLIN